MEGDPRSEAAVSRATQAEIDVWIVEDNTNLRETVAELLAIQSGLRCALAASSGEEAVAALARGDVPQVVLMDLGLPGMSGIEGIRRIRAVSPSSEVIVLTVQEADDAVFEALCAGACGYLLKPASGERIVEAIRTALSGGAPMNAFIARKVLTMFGRVARPRGDYSLTRRESELLQLLCEEKTQNEIAEALFVSPHTVDTHLRNIYGKLHVHSRTGAVAKALREGLI
jgi:DNA-binding NarL/FixJ family response regulator